MKVFYGEVLDKKFPVENVFNKSNMETMNNFWLGPEKKPANFILDLGCDKRVNKVELVNTHNSHKKNRATKEFKVLVSRNEKGPWIEVLHKTLEDSRHQNDPLPLKKFSFNGRTARYIKFEMITFYGNGGGLQYFAVHYSGILISETYSF